MDPCPVDSCQRGDHSLSVNDERCMCLEMKNCVAVQRRPYSDEGGVVSIKQHI